MTASEHDSADRPSAAQNQPHRRDFLELCGAASIAALVSTNREAAAAGPVARCLAPEFLQPQEVTDRKKWEWPLAQPQRVRDGAGKLVAAPGPKAGEQARKAWDGQHPMQVMTPKGWIHVEDIKKGLVKKLYREPRAGTETIDLKPPLIRPAEFADAEKLPKPEPVHEIGGTPRDRRELRIAPEFWHLEGAFDPSDFWDQHSFIPFYEVVLGAFDAEIVPGFQTKVWGYNRQVPGPTFVEHVNRPLVVRFHNELIAETSVHLHGGHTPSHSDGHPAFLIPPDGGIRDYFYPNGVPKVPSGDPLSKETPWDWSEATSTMWYHDHANDITAHNALMGLAGFFLVTDPWEDFLIKHHILPQPNYDDSRESRDIPIVLGDRCLCRPAPQSPKDARIHFDPFDHNGYLGNVAICNGRAFAKLEVKAHKYRLRFLNGALARVFLLQLWDAGEQSDLEGPQFDRFFTDASLKPQSSVLPWERISKDSWMLGKPVHDEALLLGMANRADVVVDFKKLLKGRKRATFFLVNLCDQRNGRGPGHGDNGQAKLAGEGLPLGDIRLSPRGDREHVPRLDDLNRQKAFENEDGGTNYNTFKLLRIDVIDD
ncbi:MAG: multicopper oxidase family protein, partial [Planctomycetota bacterium]